jgi:hypothetical protein
MAQLDIGALGNISIERDDHVQSDIHGPNVARRTGLRQRPVRGDTVVQIEAGCETLPSPRAE